MTTKHTEINRREACATFNNLIHTIAVRHNLTVDETCEMYAAFMHLYSSHFPRHLSITAGRTLSVKILEYYADNQIANSESEVRYWGLVGVIDAFKWGFEKTSN
jgi:hypothetical protein